MAYIYSPNSRPAPDLRIPVENLPHRLYRVHCPGQSKTKYSPSTGFRSLGDQEVDLFNLSDFIPTLTDHLNWYSAAASPFISTFSREKHARGWASKWFGNHPESKVVEIMEIDPRKLRDNRGVRRPVLCVREVVQRMNEDKIDVLPTVRTSRQVEDEFVCLYSIPPNAILKVVEVTRETYDNNTDPWKEQGTSNKYPIYEDEDIMMDGMDDYPSYRYEPNISYASSAAQQTTATGYQGSSQGFWQGPPEQSGWMYTPPNVNHWEFRWSNDWRSFQ